LPGVLSSPHPTTAWSWPRAPGPGSRARSTGPLSGARPDHRAL